MFNKLQRTVAHLAVEVEEQSLDLTTEAFAIEALEERLETYICLWEWRWNGFFWVYLYICYW